MDLGCRIAVIRVLPICFETSEDRIGSLQVNPQPYKP